VRPQSVIMVVNAGRSAQPSQKQFGNSFVTFGLYAPSADRHLRDALGWFSDWDTTPEKAVCTADRGV